MNIRQDGREFLLDLKLAPDTNNRMVKKYEDGSASTSGKKKSLEDFKEIIDHSFRRDLTFRWSSEVDSKLNIYASIHERI